VEFHCLPVCVPFMSVLTRLTVSQIHADMVYIPLHVPNLERLESYIHAQRALKVRCKEIVENYVFVCCYIWDHAAAT